MKLNHLNLTVTDVAETHDFLEKYFGRIPARPAPPPLRTIEPPQKAEKTVVLQDPSQPLYLEAYHQPAATHPDQPVWQAIERDTNARVTYVPTGGSSLPLSAAPVPASHPPPPPAATDAISGPTDGN